MYQVSAANRAAYLSIVLLVHRTVGLGMKSRQFVTRGDVAAEIVAAGLTENDCEKSIVSVFVFLAPSEALWLLDLS